MTAAQFLPYQDFDKQLTGIVYGIYCILTASKEKNVSEKPITPLPSEAPAVPVEEVVCKVDDLKHGE